MRYTTDRQGDPARSSAATSGLVFQISDRDGSSALPVTYTGTCSDPFRDGREVIVTGKLTDGTFVAEHDSLITKCPSKFQEEAEADPST